MNSEEFEAKFKEGGDAANRFYHRAVYHLVESPLLFWVSLALAAYGAVRVFV
jgi:hypothetical protein